MTTRRNFLKASIFTVGGLTTSSFAITQTKQLPSAKPLQKLTPPAKEAIRVAFLISKGAQMIDFAGPWEVFQDVVNPTTGKPAFELYTVSQTKVPFRTSGGLQVTPDYDLASAPKPHIIVIPAQKDDSKPVLDWIRSVAPHADIIMSVCTGAFLLAKTGLLDGKVATTHHGAINILAVDHPAIDVKSKVRFVDSGRIATAGGLSAGIDLALHVVARYFGEQVADTTAAEIEYVGYGWKNPHQVGDIFDRIEATKKRTELVCPVCEMGPIGKKIHWTYRSKTYYFCSESCKERFMKKPDTFTSRAK